ncbi:hypothetical protein ACET3X_003446 [Alternaria dauci]|uniref:Uncharacterized protein n=1 Tax=Alternaria dauci TaxID=48095 RepID=A0ABR3UU95_9PLEO
MPIFPWLDGRSDQPLNNYVTDEDGFLGLDDRMDLEHANAEEKMYKKKYWQLRKQVDEDEICKKLRADNASLRNDNKELKKKILGLENAKLSVEVQLMRREKELNNFKANKDTERGVNNTQNERLKLENKTLKENEEQMGLLLLSHDIQTPALLSTSRATLPPTPDFTDDDSDMDDADGLGVCSEWYNHGKCSLGGTRSNKCERGVHPRLVNFRTPLKPAFQSG